MRAPMIFGRAWISGASFMGVAAFADDGADRLDDVLVAGAAAQIAGQASRMSSSVASGYFRSRSVAVISMPGVQKPHCSA